LNFRGHIYKAVVPREVIFTPSHNFVRLYLRN